MTYLRSSERDHPLEFYRTMDPMGVDDWVAQMEKILEVFKHTGKQQVQLSAYMFCGVAERWWKTVRPQMILWKVLRHERPLRKSFIRSSFQSM